jgi:branched-chain amino acid transport system permease protein
VFAAVLGATVYALIVWPMRKADPMMTTIATLGLQIVMNAVAVRLWANNQPYRFPPILRSASVNLGELDVPTSSLVVLAATLVTVGVLWSFFAFTRAGLVLRTIAQNTMVARLCGIRVGRGVAYAWVISSMVGALAAMLFAPTVFLATFMMDPLQLRSFTAAVLGGMTSWPGVVVGGIGFGAIENLSSAYISNELQPAVAYLIIVAVLLIRPAGLFGKLYRGRV